MMKTKDKKNGNKFCFYSSSIIRCAINLMFQFYLVTLPYKGLNFTHLSSIDKTALDKIAL